MVHLAYATKAPAPKSEAARVAAWVYAGVLSVMVLAQLFAFEDFIPLIATYALPGGYATATLVGCLIVFTEVLGIPFLLRMPLSPLMRWFSLACEVLAAVIWTKLAVAGLAAGSMVTNSGLLGTKVTIHTGAMQVIIALALLVLAAWSSWGLRPGVKK